MPERILTIVLILNLLISLILLIVMFHRDRKKAVICLAINLMLPLIGLLFSLMMLIRFKESRYEMAAGEIIRKYKLKEMEYVDNERLQNTVPVNDALALSSEKERRTFLLGLLRKKELSSLRDSLKKALTNADTEASHYAASALMELQRESYTMMMEKEKAYRTVPLTYEDAISYGAAIINYLENSEVGQLESYTFRTRYEEVMKVVLTKFRKECQGRDYENYIDMLQKQGRLEEARVYAGQYLEHFPQAENSYLYGMKICYLQNDRAGFDEMLTKIGKSKCMLSPESLSRIRFWQQL